jgi:two-component system, chemotaxis family, chemotaxis protein CheY
MVKRKTILITDDSTALRAMLVSIIESLGDFRIVEAANGFDALRILPREQVDLIFTDINMPDINGLELISYLRNNSNYQHIPVIILTTEGSRSDIEKGKLLGANEYIIKPFDCSDLKNIIIKYLD